MSELAIDPPSEIVLAWIVPHNDHTTATIAMEIIEIVSMYSTVDWPRRILES